MSETWTANGDDSTWSAAAPISSLPRALCYTETDVSTGRHNGTYAFSPNTTMAEARRRVALWNAPGLRHTYAIVETSTAPQPANGQKAPAPMKLTFARVQLISSLQSIIDAASAKFTEAQTKFDAAKATATSVVDANLESIAVANGFKADDAGLAAFKASPSYGYAVQNMQSTLGLPSVVPSKPNNKSVEASIATLSLATDTNLEIEEGHAFLQHLRQ